MGAKPNPDGLPVRRMRPLRRHHPAEKLDDRGAEDVVAVAGDHVGGVLHVDVLGVRALAQEALRAFFAQHEIGRASCRERVCQYVWVSVVAVAVKKKESYRNQMHTL